MLRIEVRIDRHHAARTHEQRVAVGRLLGDDFAADVAVGAGAVLHHHRLAQRLLQRLADGARELVGRAARREVHDDADRLAGPGLGEGRCRARRRRQRAAAQPERRRRRRGDARRFMRGLLRSLLIVHAAGGLRRTSGPWACASKRIGCSLTGRARRAVLHQRGVQRLAGIVGQRGLARRGDGLGARFGATAPCARWSSTCSRFSLPRSLVAP